MTVISKEQIIAHVGAPSASYKPVVQESVIYNYLREHGFGFQTYVHPPCRNEESRIAIEQVVGFSFVRCELLINKGNTEFYMVMLPADKPFKASELRKQLGCSSLRQANKEESLRLVQTTPGVMSPFALLFDENHKIKLLVDSELEDWHCFLCHPNTNSATIRMYMDDFANSFIPSLGNKCYAIDLTRDI